MTVDDKWLENFLVKKKRTKLEATHEQLMACMDYLHGKVAGDEFRAACQYEYARESAVLRRAAELLFRDPTAFEGEISLKIENEFHCVSWFIGTDWMFVWHCPSFPAKSWNQLSEAERTELLYGLPLSTTKPRPLPLGEVIFLTHYLDQLKEMAKRGTAELKKHAEAEATAAKARAEGKKDVPTVRPRQSFYPILELPSTPFAQVLLPLDFSKTRNQLLREIDLWLKLPENQARFDKYKPKTEAGTEKEAKDRLKDLAAWRVYRELGYIRAREFVYENRECDSGGTPRAFYAPRRGPREQSADKAVPVSQADLFYDQSGFIRARSRARAYLAKLFPWEFGTFATDAGTFATEAIERFKRALKQARRKNS